jgi:hypothetical protein
MNTYPGLPISYVEPNLIEDGLTTQNGFILTTQDGYFLSWNLEWQTYLTLFFDDTFPLIYLKDFSDNLYNLGTINTSTISILNPFYIDGEDVNNFDYTFEFAQADNNDGNGPFVFSVVLAFNTGIQTDNVNYASVTSSPQTANQKLTATVVFDSNKQLLIKLDDAELQGIEVFNNDPRVTTKASLDNFIIEDFNNRYASGVSLSENSSFVRVFNAGQKFVRYRIPATRLFGAEFDPLQSYEPEQQVYYSGEFWNCIESTTGTYPDNSSSYWESADIPYRFRDFLVNAVSCDFLRSEARFEEAEVLNNMAEIAVQQQIDVLLRQQGQVQRMNMAYTY